MRSTQPGIGLASTYALYTASAFISFFLVRKFLKETAGKELEEMEGWTAAGVPQLQSRSLGSQRSR